MEDGRGNEGIRVMGRRKWCGIGKERKGRN
jgi:hypothetical protein